MTTPRVPTGFEAAHEEWLSCGGKTGLNYKKFYESQYWKLIRQAVLTSKGFQCCRCGGEASQVHHLNYKYSGEDHFYPENLVAVCRSCHGLVEYARKAEELIPRIERRISLCEGFLEDAPGCLGQNAEHIYARLLEYQHQLAILQQYFAKEIRYSDSRKEIEGAMFSRGEKYEQQAKSIVSTWSGNEKEKAERLIPVLEAEMANYWKFIEEVFAPVQKQKVEI